MNKVKDELGDRMKMYEGAEAQRRLMPLLPVIARLDGRSFHSFTRGMDRPFDATFSSCMIDTAKALVQESGACMGYVQSDEVTLAWHSEDMRSQIYFDGRVAKMLRMYSPSRYTKSKTEVATTTESHRAFGGFSFYTTVLSLK
jgi:tRNA(His) 5'-end guanylyltransferase